MTLFILLLSSVGQAPTAPFFNELHYDNTGVDTGEGFEIAGPAGLDLTGWSVLLYNGGNGTVYSSVDLSGIVPDQQDGFGSLFFDAGSMQNGSPDGLALVDATLQVAQFLSYEGVFVATAGAAAGMTSIDIGVSESSATPVGASLQLTGSGSRYAHFQWSVVDLASYGAINDNQRFAAAVVPLPAGLPLLACALLSFGLRRRRVATASL